MNKNSELNNYVLWTAIITPMLSDLKIDFGSLEKLLRRQEMAKNGVILLGSTGEGLALSRKDKEAVLKFSLGLKLSIPMIAGVQGHQLEEALDWMSFAKTAGIAGFLAVTPYYAKPGVQGQKKWFQQILDHANLPVMLYNVPSRAGVRLDPMVVTELKDHPALWALKESSGSLASLLEYQSSNPGLTLFCGDDGLIAEFAQQGAKGLISVAANVWPEATHKITELCLAGNAQDLAFWPECADALFLASNPVPVKWLHYFKREIKSPVTRAPLEAGDFKETEKLIAADLKVETWLKERSTR